MKNYKILSFICLLVILIIAGVTIYKSYANKNEDINIKTKTKAEIEHLDSTLLNLFNELNNIQFENYKISTNKINQKTANDGTTSSGGESSQSGESSSDSSSQGSSGEQGSSQGGSNSKISSEDSGGNGAASSEAKNNEKYKLEETGILTNNEDIDWNKIKNEIENMYTSLSGMTLDLYQTNTNNQDIINFNREYDNLTTIVETENKQDTLEQLSILYDYVPKFADNCIDDNMEKSVFRIKNYIFKAYSIVDVDDWNSVANNVDLAIREISQLLTSTDKDIQEKEYNINKAYVVANELKNGIVLKDRNVFLIKYKNLLEELENM